MKRTVKINESDIALFLDGHLSPERCRVIEHQIATSESLRSELRSYEQVKTLLAASPRLTPSLETDRFILNFIQSEPPSGTPWFELVLAACESLALGLSMMPRTGIVMLVLGTILGTSLGATFFIENKQAPQVSARLGNPGYLIAGNRLPLREGANIKLGIPIVTGQKETITIHRKDLFSLQLDENTEASTKKVSFLARFGRNEVNLDRGTVLFKTEKLLPEGGIAIGTSICTITNHGTVALINYNPSGTIAVSVLEGSVSIDFKKSLSGKPMGRVFVKNLQEFTIDPENPFGVTQPISQKALEQLTDFTSDRLILLGLPQNNAAAALVDTEKLSAVFTYFNIPEANVKNKLDHVKKLFVRNDQDTLLEARRLLYELGNEYEKSGHLHMSAPLFLFVSSISSYLDDNETVLTTLSRIYENKGYSGETRALAKCAIGIIQDRRQNTELAREAYQIVISHFSDSSVYPEAKERLKRLLIK